MRNAELSVFDFDQWETSCLKYKNFKIIWIKTLENATKMNEFYN